MAKRPNQSVSSIERSSIQSRGRRRPFALPRSAPRRAHGIMLARRRRRRSYERLAEPRRTRAVGNPGGGDHQASQRGVIGEGEHGRWGHSLRKSFCFSMCAGSAYWGHLSAKTLAISTNGLIRSESRRRAACPQLCLRRHPILRIHVRPAEFPLLRNRRLGPLAVTVLPITLARRAAATVCAAV